jgi:hypothetical protein
MDRRARSGAVTHLIRSARVVAIGQQNTTHTMAGKLIQIFPSRLYRIDAEISTRVAYEMAVKVIAMRLGKPRPGIDATYDFSHLSQS